MKKNVLLTTIILILGMCLNAQTLIFEDDFESYADGTGVGGTPIIDTIPGVNTLDYAPGAGGFLVASADGNKYVQASEKADGSQFKFWTKINSLTVGEKYAWEVNIKTNSDAVWLAVTPIDNWYNFEYTNEQWTVYRDTFVVPDGTTETVLKIHGKNNTCFDDLKIYKLESDSSNEENEEEEAQKLVVNGDFEKGDLSGWTVASGEVETADPIAGTTSYLRGWGKGDLIEQTIATEAGKAYSLSYEGKVAWQWIYINAKIIDAADGTTEIAATSIFNNNQSPASLDFTAPAGGSVILKFTKTADSPGKAWIDNVSIVENVTTAVGTIKENTLNVFPNPSNGILTLSNETAISTYRVFNASGQLVQERSALLVNEVSIDLSQEKKGLYMLQVTDESGNTQTSKLIIK